MKKILEIFYFLVLIVVSCNADNKRIASRIAQEVGRVKQILKQEGITDISVADFKRRMNEVADRMPQMSKGKLHAAVYRKEAILPETLLKYSTHPTDEEAEFLRSWASTSTFWAEIIIPEMDKQLDPRYKFNKGSLESDD